MAQLNFVPIVIPSARPFETNSGRWVYKITKGMQITGRFKRFAFCWVAAFKCCEHGEYILGPVGAEPRCSVHGSMSEIDTRDHRR